MRSLPTNRAVLHLARVATRARVPTRAEKRALQKASTSAFRSVLGPDFRRRRVAVADVGGNDVVG